ncbi:MAG: hypothetical protein OEW19_18705, partial [Acidobacteriota bacterium]|nr:hypothetical protein [Acidobacteriota bacterium]
DAFLIAALRPLEKKLMGPVAAVPAAIRSLLRYSFPAFEVTTAAGTRTVTLAVAANIRRYGGPWQLTPGARSDGERLELFSYSGRGRAAIIGLALSLLVGRHLKAAGSRVESVRKVTIQAAGALPFQIDGDMLAPARDRPLEITVSDHKISMLAPAP